MLCPCRKALQARIDALPPRTALEKREGKKTADDRFRAVTREYVAEYPLQIVEIDHTRVDVFVVDDVHRQPIQRPWLTLLVDVGTRMVAGYYLSLEGPSATSVALALQHAVLPKEDWLSGYGIGAAWPVSGFPDILHMDNGREFHSQALKRGAAEYGIALQYRPVATPHYGGHIERLIGTMMGEMHVLPGTTFSDIEERGAYDPERHAVMTLRELDHWVAIQIVGRYHQEVHKELGRPPLAVWQEEIKKREKPIFQPKDAKQFFYDFLPCEERIIQRSGIRMFNIWYWEGLLSVWTNTGNRKLLVKYDPRNLSQVFVQDSEGEHWPIRYRDLKRPPITLWEQKQAHRALIEQGRHEINEDMIFDAVETQRLLVREAAQTTKAARRAQQRSSEALRPRSSLVERLPPPQTAEEPENDEPVEPYEIEIWS